MRLCARHPCAAPNPVPTQPSYRPPAHVGICNCSVAVHSSHNAAVACFDRETGRITVCEIERLTGYKNAGLTEYKPVAFPMVHLRHALEQVGCDGVADVCVTTGGATIPSEIIEGARFATCPHHRAHASGTFYQSPFERALILSFDGGGDDGVFNVYHAPDRATGVELLGRRPIDFGFAYMAFGQYLHDIDLERSIADGALVYAGKLMGLCAYGAPVSEWLVDMRTYYHSYPTVNDYRDKFAWLGKQIGVDFVERKTSADGLRGKLAYDLAATSQRAFEDLVLEMLAPYLAQYPDAPLCLTGGCALNVLLNERMRREIGRPLFVAPNSSDCGIAAGALLDQIRPAKPVDLMYAGGALLDLAALPSYIQERTGRVEVLDGSPPVLARKLMDGLIVGVARGCSEHGPRALGNRSILCNPASPDMKDTLNAKVKNREWYRPFAPVVRVEEASRYFELDDESPYMNFAVRVRPEWVVRLAAITHVDGTARVQTLRRAANPWLYDVLEEFERLAGHGVLLNTSFNVSGKPLLSTVREAFDVFDRTRLDALVIENLYIGKAPGASVGVARC